MTDAFTGNREPTSESLEVIRKFAGVYANRADLLSCREYGGTDVVPKGPAHHKDVSGGALCHRHHEAKHAEFSLRFWISLCVSMSERGRRHRMHFLAEDSPLRGALRTITTDTMHASAGRVT